MAIDFPSSPTTGQQYTFAGVTYTFTAQGVWSASGSGSGYTASSTAPASPVPGDHWYDLSTGILSVWVNDGNSSQWVMVSPVGGGTVSNAVAMRRFTNSGTYTPTPGMQYCIVECVGGGGGGGSTSGAVSTLYIGGGGGASGGYSRSVLTAAQVGAAQTITIGGGGAGGAAAANNAANGGDTSFGALVVARGGGGGSYSVAGGTFGGQGGIPANPGTGDVAFSGAPGGQGGVSSSVGGAYGVVPSGEGGSSVFGGGARGIFSATANATNGDNAGSLGSGGGGGQSSSVAVNAAGGNGSSGIVIITEYISTIANPAVVTPATPASFDALAYNGIQINGSIDVSQESGTGNVPLGAANAKYVVDGFYGVNLGATRVGYGVQQPISSLVGFPNCLGFTCTTPGALAAGDAQYITQVIEGYRWSRLTFGFGAASPVTIAFWINATVTGTMAVAVRNGASNRSYVANVTINTAGAWEYKTVTVPGDVTGTWSTNNAAGATIVFCFGAGATYQTAPNTWTAGNFFATSSTTNFWAAASTVYLTGVVVLPGIQAPTAAQSPFIMRPYDQELMTCQRYFERQAGSFGAGYCYAGNGAVINLAFKVKRATPTLIPEVGAASYFVAMANSANTSLASMGGLICTSTNGGQVVVTTAGGLVAGDGTAMNSANALFFDARL